MSSRFLLAIVFVAGLAGGWFGKTWWESHPPKFDTVIAKGTGVNQRISVSKDAVSTDIRQATQSDPGSSNQADGMSQNTSDNYPKFETQRDAEDIAGLSAINAFNKLLKERQYFDAMTLFQEQKQQSEKNSIPLKKSLLNELEILTEARNSSDFSALAENYLSAYYDDIDVLLLLAEFNQVNGSYLEVVNVFLLAKTYAYSNADQRKVASSFNRFVMQIDNSYTGQKDWWSLINLYSHINTSGLMISTYRYRQALAHLRSGDEVFAIEQFKQLLDDSLVGESAAEALSSLTSETETAVIVEKSSLEDADSIPLQKLGNQYAVDLDNNRQNSVKLLIDTGASMTAMSRESFNSINVDGDAVEQGSRMFRTANGLVNATVFSIPELRLGPHQLVNTQIAVINFDSSRRVDGLLGMNILGQFRFQIDQDSSQLLLSKK